MSHYTVYGALGSPYSLKVRAALRAKRLVHVWRFADAAARGEIFQHVKAPVIPVIQRPDGTWTNDSTPFLLELEERGEGRPILPEDPAARFACRLIEDMADEWSMKAMFHYRWAYSQDAEQLSRWLIFDTVPNAGRDGIEPAAADIAQRQIGRMALVGCTPETAPVIEASAKRLMAILDQAATGPSRFLFGETASLADLALYGQLWQLRTDPTPAAWMRAEAPYLFRWLEHVDDASGAEGPWLEDALASEPVAALMAMAGDTYLPFLEANAAALAKGQETFSVQIEGKPFEQGVFKYQLRCLEALRAEWAALEAGVRDRFVALLGPGAGALA